MRTQTRGCVGALRCVVGKAVDGDGSLDANAPVYCLCLPDEPSTHNAIYIKRKSVRIHAHCLEQMRVAARRVGGLSVHKFVIVGSYNSWM